MQKQTKEDIIDSPAAAETENNINQEEEKEEYKGIKGFFKELKTKDM